MISACSELFLSLRIASASFDLRRGTRDAFTEQSTLTAIGNRDDRGYTIGTQIAYGQFLFELLRMDKFLLDTIIADADPKIWRGGGLNQRQAKKYISRELRTMESKTDRSAGGNVGGGIVFNKILSERNQWIAENEVRLHKCWGESGIARDIYEFLTYVPSNIVWHCYLNAIPRAIADRATTRLERGGYGGGDGPHFMVMQHHGGRSALAMFVFSKGAQEFRQIIKLSDGKRIQHEAENYRKYVRYNVPLSARLPYSGLAFEADGDTTYYTHTFGDSLPMSRRSYGTLVSDLIAGTRDEVGPVTFLAKVADLIWAATRQKGAANTADQQMVKDFEAAIDYQFQHNTSRWKAWVGTGKWVPAGKGVTNVVREITRIQLDGVSMLTKIENSAEDPGKKHDQMAKQCIEKFAGHSIDKVVGTLLEFDREGADLHVMNADGLGAIIHGDLNGRNLVWSQDYLKFFVIDFERVGMGFDGAVQLRLTFSLLSDLVDEAYQREKFGPGVLDEVLSKRKSEMNVIIEDVTGGINHIGLIMSRVQLWAAETAPSVDLSFPAQDAVSAKAISTMLNENVFSKGNGSFWAFSLTMTAAKQFEYALRAIDDPCADTLERLTKDSIDRDLHGLNFYGYYTDEELRSKHHDKFVFGKVSRALFAYQALARILYPDLD